VIHGIAVVDKPAGMTSHDVVGRCRRVFGQRKVGHGGTLDPDATGVLVVGLGRATRLLQWVSDLDKTYTCRVVLGVATTTLDAAGDVTGRWDMGGVDIDRARAAATTLTGEIDQVPPMVSALKVGGRRLHELAREGIEVERAPRRVRVARFDIDGPLPGAAPSTTEFTATVTCSSGTYVRVLAADLGSALGGGGHLTDLRRTSVGRWGDAGAVALDDLDEAAVRPCAEAVAHLGTVRVGPDLLGAVGHGSVLDAGVLGATGDGPWAVLDTAGELLAVYGPHGPGRAKPVVVLTGAG
jgi:tRNA pseudouridine55 synthase